VKNIKLRGLAVALFVTALLFGACSQSFALTWEQFKAAYQTNQAVTVGVVGDSTYCGYGANPGPTTWPTNGLAYGYLQAGGAWGPNWTEDGNGLVIQTDGTYRVTRATSINAAIPGSMQLLYANLKAKNASSELWNYAASGENSSGAITNGRVAALAALSPKPDIVIISIGINDWKYGHQYDHFATWAANMRTLVSQVLANGMLPVLVKQHYIYEWDVPGTLSPDQWTIGANWATWQSEYDVIAAEHVADGVRVIDVYTPSVSYGYSHLYDPFHESNTGYAFTESIIVNAFNEAGGSSSSAGVSGLGYGIAVSNLGATDTISVLH
jgi:lysophospholipase L1-like esterase